MVALMNTFAEPSAMEYLAVGLMVTMTDQADCDVVSLRVPSCETMLTWRRVGADISEDSSPHLLLMSVPRVPEGNAMRAVLHPVPRDHRPWNLLDKDDQLTVGIDGRTAGSATVAWIAVKGSGLAEGKLQELIHWCHGGPVPDFRLSPAWLTLQEPPLVAEAGDRR